VDNIEFINPMKIGDLVIIDSVLEKVGTTSMGFKVEVYSENLTTGNRVLNCECNMVFVAVDEKGVKRKLDS
jgi:acyl-CoA hydrolase